MPKHSDVSCEVEFQVIGEEKFIRFYPLSSKLGYLIPMELIDKIKEDEWAYDSAQHNERKEKVKS